MHSPMPHLLPVELLLLAYRGGVFPMADGREDPDLFWVEPRERAIVPLDRFRLSRSLAKVLRQDRFTVSVNTDFPAVIAACAAPRPGHPETWISHRIEDSYIALHRAGHAHSVECRLDGELVGGLYGVSFDRVFCGESMFSRADNASKVALAWLVALMRKAGYMLLDCQFMTEHLASLGAVAVTRERYGELLTEASADGVAASLPGAFGAFMAQVVGAGGASGAGASGGGAGAGAGSALRDAEPLSSPGKLIAQSLTQTS
jgi:leucyl/phenylalanyl-tRNA--protein transferase